jgi:putative phosphoesterase
MIIGVLSDTHGRLDPKVIDCIRRTDLVLHAGDLDGPDILHNLGNSEKVTAVRGNMDFGSWSQALHQEEFVDASGILIYMIHDLHRISVDPEAADIRIVISGHTHRSSAIQKNGILYLNPGSASFPRGGAKASMALIEIKGGHFTYRHIFI